MPKINPRFATPLLASSLALMPLLAAAHTGADAGAHHGMGFVAGLLHPFTGLDHLLAMVAVGLWSALAMPGPRRAVAPLAFALTLGVGALAGMAGVAVPAIEPMIAASLLVLGLLLGARRTLPATATAALAGGFALFHGAAHGLELSGAASPAAALLGMLLGTAALHLAGLALGAGIARRHVWWARIAGAGVAGFGAVLLTQLA